MLLPPSQQTKPDHLLRQSHDHYIVSQTDPTWMAPRPITLTTVMIAACVIRALQKQVGSRGCHLCRKHPLPIIHHGLIICSRMCAIIPIPFLVHHLSYTTPHNSAGNCATSPCTTIPFSPRESTSSTQSAKSWGLERHLITQTPKESFEFLQEQPFPKPTFMLSMYFF